MKIIFFGSSHFAVPALEVLIRNNYDVALVVTQPDKKKGRHLRLSGTDVKAVAKSAGLKVYQSENINAADSVKHLKNESADLFVVVAYGQILSQSLLDIPKIFAINIHPSLLPKYRGAAPINWAIINNEQSNGVTIIKLIRKMDAGPMLLQKEIAISEADDSVSLEAKLSRLGAELLIESLIQIKNKTYRLTEQDEKKVVIAPKLKKSDGEIDWSKPVVKVNNLIKGCLPWPSAFTYFKGKLLKIYKTEIREKSCESADLPSGGISSIHKGGFEVITGSGLLLIKELQLEGGDRMTAEEFVHGHKIKIGDILG